VTDIVSYGCVDGVATITMDDGKVNAVSPTLQAGLHAALDRAEADAVVIVLRGRDGAFSAGFDLDVLGRGGGEAIAMVMGGWLLSRRLLAFPRPVVIACTGHAVAMGAFLTLTADHRVGTTRRAKFATNEVAIGMTMPHTAILLMRHRLTPAACERAMLLAETFTPEGAVAAGFVDELVDPEQLDDHLATLGARLASLDVAAHRRTKERARAALLAAIDDAMVHDRADLERVFR
jgi:enoyl-CoA hydratase